MHYSTAVSIALKLGGVLNFFSAICTVPDTVLYLGSIVHFGTKIIPRTTKEPLFNIRAQFILSLSCQINNVVQSG